MAPVPRSVTARRVSIRKRLRQAMSSRQQRPIASVTDADLLGEDFRGILNDVVTGEGRQPLKHYGPTGPTTTYAAAVEFLITVVQT